MSNGFIDKPRVRVLLVGSCFSKDLEVITRSVAAMATSHLYQTQYAGDYDSYRHYLAQGIFQGEYYSVGYATDLMYQESEELFDVIIYISEPNRGFDPLLRLGYKSDEIIRKAEADKVHLFYLTKSSITTNNFVVQYYGRDRTSVIERIIDILTKEWHYEHFDSNQG